MMPAVTKISTRSEIVETIKRSQKCVKLFQNVGVVILINVALKVKLIYSNVYLLVKKIISKRLLLIFFF